MISKNNYLVYNKQKDTLDGITDPESKLIWNLSSMPEYKFSTLINEFYDNEENKVLALERLEEIFYYYYTSSPSDIFTPFHLRGRAVVENILKILDEKINKPIPNERLTPKEINIPDSFINKIRDAYGGLIDRPNDLFKLLSGEKIDKKLIFKGDAKRLAGTIFSLMKSGLINNEPAKIISWSINSFQYIKSNTPKDLIQSTMEKYLTGSENPCNEPVQAIEILAKEYRDTSK